MGLLRVPPAGRAIEKSCTGHAPEEERQGGLAAALPVSTLVKRRYPAVMYPGWPSRSGRRYWPLTVSLLQAVPMPPTSDSEQL